MQGALAPSTGPHRPLLEPTDASSRRVQNSSVLGLAALPYRANAYRAFKAHIDTGQSAHADTCRRRRGEARR